MIKTFHYDRIMIHTQSVGQIFDLIFHLINYIDSDSRELDT